MYSKINLGELDEREIEHLDPRLKAVGYELQPRKMRPSVWIFDAGDENNRHRQREQEELYYVIEGTASMEVDGEEFDIQAGDIVVVPPESWRQITATESCTVLAIGAPNVKDDEVLANEEESA